MMNTSRWLIVLVITTMTVMLSACSAASSRDTQEVSNSTTINVLAKDFSFSLETSQAKTGLITFVVQNTGSMHHDFAISGNGVEEKTPLIEPGERATFTVDLTPGTYTFICTISGHEQLGMVGSISVTAN